MWGTKGDWGGAGWRLQTETHWVKQWLSHDPGHGRYADLYCCCYCYCLQLPACLPVWAHMGMAVAVGEAGPTWAWL